jgi:GNAT superfamily N-acetyltransferase
MVSTAEHVARVEQAQWREVSATLADAFSDDPVFSWLLPDAASRRPALERFFEIETRRIVLRHGRSLGSHSDGGVAGVALVLPPGCWKTPLRVEAAEAPTYARVFGRRLPHALGVLAQMERRHLRAPHVYFPYIGVVAASQGQGLGTALMQPELDRCDREGLPAYLEASNPRCARLYARLGFTPLEQIRPFGAPPIQLMIRAPAQER